MAQSKAQSKARTPRQPRRGTHPDAMTVDAAQLVEGTAHEMEHTDEWDEAASTALDHLAEDPHYYTRLHGAFPESRERDYAAARAVGLRPNPYRTEHAARQHDPWAFAEFRRMSIDTKDGKRVDFVLGIYPGGGSEVQSVRFPANQWTTEQAEDWLRRYHKHDMVEAASPYGSDDMEGGATRANPEGPPAAPPASARTQVKCKTIKIPVDGVEYECHGCHKPLPAGTRAFGVGMGQVVLPMCSMVCAFDHVKKHHG